MVYIGSIAERNGVRVGKSCFVTMSYIMKNRRGEVVDASEADEPLVYLHGHGEIVPGLERALEGKVAGEKLSVILTPKDAYGDRDESKVLRLRRSQMELEVPPEVGQVLAAEADDGSVVPLWITAIAGEVVLADGNHPLAGETLEFWVEVHEVRDATDAELRHGHVRW